MPYSANERDARLIVSEILEHFAEMEAIGKSDGLLRISAGGAQSRIPLHTTPERKFLRRLRNQFVHGFLSFLSNGSVTIIDKQRTHNYSLRKLTVLRDKVRSMSVRERLNIQIETEIECKECGLIVSGNTLLTCGHATYEQSEVDKAALLRKPSNGIARIKLIFKPSNC